MPDAQQPRRVGRPPATRDGRTVPERLLEVACTLFAEKGFERTSVQDVVTAAGVTKGAMYHYFGSKDDLLHEIYARVLRMQMEHLEKYVVAGGELRDRVLGAAADVVVTTIQNIDSTTIFFRSLHHLGEEKQREVRRDRRRYHEAFRDLVAEGQRAGLFRDDVPADLVVDYFFGSVHHLPMWWRPDGHLSAEDVGRSFATLLVDSLHPRR